MLLDTSCIVDMLSCDHLLAKLWQAFLTALRCAQNLGGAKYHFLTHQDDVAGHDKWHEALATERIIHNTETNSSQRTK